MARTTKAEKEESIERLKELLKECGPEGSATLLIVEYWGGSGTACQVDVHVMQARDDNGGRPTIDYWLAFNVARAFGYRMSKQDRLIMGGYGYNRSTEIVSGLTRLVGQSHLHWIKSYGEVYGDYSPHHIYERSFR